MKKTQLALVASLIALSGCASSAPASPHLVMGRYYLAGDAQCMYYSVRNDGARIDCMDSDMRPTGFRYPMTGGDMQAYQYNQVRQRQEFNAMLDRLNQGNAAMAAQTQQTLQNVQNQAQPPQVGSWANGQDRSTTLVYCKELGRYVVSCDVRE